MDHSMTHEEWRTFNHDKKKFKSLAENRYYCYCGHWVYKDKQKYFKERLRGYINGS